MKALQGGVNIVTDLRAAHHEQTRGAWMTISAELHVLCRALPRLTALYRDCTRRDSPMKLRTTLNRRSLPSGPKSVILSYDSCSCSFN